jgi:hypothetical protein
VRARLQLSTQMTLLEGLQQADNLAWWRIRTADGREGRVAGEELRTQPDLNGLLGSDGICRLKIDFVLPRRGGVERYLATL